jgi:hypothetical protein
MQPKKLEQYKYFQPIAWTVCISFAGFVGMLALQLKTTIINLEQSTLSFDQRLQNVEAAVGVNPTGAIKQ